MPALGEDVVPRPRVEGLLTGLLEQHRLIFVYASAGAGKTTAILQAVQRLQRPVVWLDADSTDVATGRLLVYLEAALSAQVPEVAGIAAAALSARVPHAEVAGLLAEAVGDRPVVIVLDNAERLAGSAGALDVLAAFARYLRPAARFVLSSRAELPFSSTVGSSPWVAAIGEEDLALTVEEARRALHAARRDDIDPVDALVETGGWMTGVLFEAWRASDHVIGLGGENDPLHGYLATEILGQLPDADADFLVRTSVLEEVTAAHAEALGIEHASVRLHSLAGRRLPVSWQRGHLVMRSHPRFREFLQVRLARLSEVELRELYRAHARLLLAQNHTEEAVQQYLAAGLLDDALLVVSPVLEHVIERTDFELAETWLSTLAPARGVDDLSLATAEFMLIVVREDYTAGVDLADRLHRRGLRGGLARTSGRAVGLMAWCYLHAGRPCDMDAVLDESGPDPDADAARYSLNIVRDDPAYDSRRAHDMLTGGPMDALVLRTHYDLGRLPLVAVAPSSPWAAKATESWLISALLTSGHIERAYELYHRLIGSTYQSVWLTGLLGPRLMLEIGDADEAWRLLREGRQQILRTGSLMLETYSLLIQAEFELRLNANPAGALELLNALGRHPVGSHYAFVVEQREMLIGLAELMTGDDTSAVQHLRRAVAGMRAGKRLLHLPTAAIYLSEAEWRFGAESLADDMAELAVEVARRQGSNHYLLAALAQFPDVLARRIDLESTDESGWHELGRALLVRGITVTEVLGGSVELAEFGRVAITASGVEVNPGLNKSVELLAFMANHDRKELSRETLLDALFDGRRNASTSSYLRQAALRLRRAVPDLLDPNSPQGVLRLSGGVRVNSESRRFVGLLGEAAAMSGEERLNLLLDALGIAERGSYLPTIGSTWVEERRQRLDELVRSARLEAAEVAFTLGRYHHAGQLAEQVVKVDPYRESGWRLVMRLAQLHGDHDRVVSAYRSCEQALGEIGAVVSETTAALLRGARR